MSQYLETKILGHITNQTAFTAPNPWLALCITAPTSADTGTTLTAKEATYTGYKRIKITTVQWNAAVAGSPSKITNIQKENFAACTAGESKIKAVALCDAEVNGNLLVWCDVTEFTVSVANSPAEALAGAIEITLL